MPFAPPEPLPVPRPGADRMRPSLPLPGEHWLACPGIRWDRQSRRLHFLNRSVHRGSSRAAELAGVNNQATDEPARPLLYYRGVKLLTSSFVLLLLSHEALGANLTRHGQLGAAKPVQPARAGLNHAWRSLHLQRFRAAGWASE